ncbi:MAG: thiol:disulfide interchange protein [Caulobacter sp.]|nr:thiol:disulfide interchange protein [Caulobacter sp.]
MREAETGLGSKSNGVGKAGRMAGAVVLALLYVTLAACNKPTSDLTSLKTGEFAALKIAAPGKPGPASEFFDPQGKPVKLSDFKGQVVVLNLWATWCAPCVKELPTLAKLSADFAGKPVKVLTVSVDKPANDNLVVSKIASLPPLIGYRDPKYKLAFGLDPQPPGFPATVIFDKNGVEVARMEKDADWSSPQAHKLIEAVLAKP